MRRVLFLGAAALLLAAPALRADLGPKPGPRPPFQPQPGVGQAPKAKVTIEVDEKATEPRMLVPIQVMIGGGFGGAGGALGAGGFGGAAGAGGAIGVGGFGGAAGVGGIPPGALGQAGALGQQGSPLPGVGGQQGASGQKGVFGELGGKPQSPPPKEKEEKPDQGQDGAQAALPLSTMVVGLALTLSLSTGGLWLARRKNGPGGLAPLTVFVAVLGLALAGSAVVWANGAPPFRQPPRQPQPQRPPAPPQVPGPLPTLGKFDGVKVEIIQQGDTIRLILPKRMAEQFKAKNK